MMKAVALLCVVAMVAEASSPFGVVYPFPIDTVLRCRRPDPSNPGGTIEVPTPTIPIIPGEPDEVWLPEPVRFRPPRGTIDVPWLVEELPPPGIIDGAHFLDCPEEPPTNGRDPTPPVPSGMIPPADTINASTIQLEGLGFDAAEQAVIMEFWNEVSFPACDDASYEITRLPEYYWPPCYAGGRCSGESCSLPEGQRCIPSNRNTVLLPVFRWDCCWDYDGSVWRWACGMYLVNVQIITRCFCACRPVFA